MQIVPYSPNHLSDLTRLINAHIEALPPYWTLSEAQVAYTIANTKVLWDAHYADEEPETPPEWQTWCALDSGRVTAAAQIEFSGDCAVINWLLADVGHPSAGAALLAFLREKALEAKNDSMAVMSRCSLGVGWLGFPAFPHIADLLKTAGFERGEQWQMMTGQIHTESLPGSPEIPNLELRWNIKEASLEWLLEAYVDGNLAGECQAWGIPPHFAACPGFNEWITVEYLEVTEPFRGHGLGRYLLAEQMRFQAQRGIKHVIAWTEVSNIAPRHVNLACGMGYGPECWTWGTKL